MISWILAALVAAAPGGGTAPATHLVVETIGFADSTGVAVLRLLGPDDPLRPEPCGRQISQTIHQGRARFDLGGIAPGRWAILVFQDKNRNGTIDHGALHLPSEPLGFSGSYRIGLLAGRPTFEKLAVQLASGPQRMVIHVR